MDSFFEKSNLPEDLVAYIRKNVKQSWCGDRGWVRFPSSYRDKIEKLLPEIKKHYERERFSVYYKADTWNHQVELTFIAIGGGSHRL